MADGYFNVPTPVNEPVLNYTDGSPEKAALEAELKRQASEVVEIPLIIGGKEVRTDRFYEVIMPHDHGHVLAKVHMAGTEEAKMAVRAAQDAKAAWADTPAEARAAIFLRAAELLAGPWRQVANASTMLGQSKTCHQAEIDSACEMVDFLRYNPKFMQDIYAQQPISAPGMWNQIEYRPLDGFLYAITPFNFTSIGGNLPTSPALMGNTVIWKPSRTAILSNYYYMRMFEEAGVPAGVINFLPGSSGQITDELLSSPDFGGIHYTGSTEIFQLLWQTASNNLKNYRAYPRIVGETGGKDFIFAHVSADPKALIAQIVRGAYEYQGQKCSAASRAYIPQSLWDRIKDELFEQVRNIPMGDVRDFSNFMGAVIDEASMENCRKYIDEAKNGNDAEVVVGGEIDGSKGFFVQPTIILAKDPKCLSMREEIFGPILTVFVYPDDQMEEALKLCDEGSPYALTGAVFARDRKVIEQVKHALRFTAGNFYINDKPTGAVVGQQPFGGARASGTNDKAGSYLNLIRWASPRSIKETFVTPTDYRYPYMG
jgi:1-pyrroline-5-carboxylate dehydrogenase